jgi:hypothetical protein
MARKSEHVSNELDIKSIRGHSTELNTQRQVGAEKPMFSGKVNPGDTKPPYDKEKTVPKS